MVTTRRASKRSASVKALADAPAPAPTALFTASSPATKPSTPQGSSRIAAPPRSEMHPSLYHHQKTRLIESVRGRSSGTNTSADHEPVVSPSVKLSSSQNPGADGDLSTGFSFRMPHGIARTLNFSAEALKVMAEADRNAARIRQHMAQRPQDYGLVPSATGLVPAAMANSGRVMATPKSRAGRFSDVHKKQFNRMDSIVSHPAALRSATALNVAQTPVGGGESKLAASPSRLRSTPTQSLKRTHSKVDLDAGKMLKRSPSKSEIPSLKRTRSKADLTEATPMLAASVTRRPSQLRSPVAGGVRLVSAAAPSAAGGADHEKDAATEQPVAKRQRLGFVASAGQTQTQTQTQAASTPGRVRSVGFAPALATPTATASFIPAPPCSPATAPRIGAPAPPLAPSPSPSRTHKFWTPLPKRRVDRLHLPSFFTRRYQAVKASAPNVPAETIQNKDQEIVTTVKVPLKSGDETTTASPTRHQLPLFVASVPVSERPSFLPQRSPSTKSILRNAPRRLYSNDPNKVAAGTHLPRFAFGSAPSNDNTNNVAADSGTSTGLLSRLNPRFSPGSALTGTSPVRASAVFGGTNGGTKMPTTPAKHVEFSAAASAKADADERRAAAANNGAAKTGGGVVAGGVRYPDLQGDLAAAGIPASPSPGTTGVTGEDTEMKDAGTVTATAAPPVTDYDSGAEADADSPQKPARVFAKLPPRATAARRATAFTFRADRTAVFDASASTSAVTPMSTARATIRRVRASVGGSQSNSTTRAAAAAARKRKVDDGYENRELDTERLGQEGKSGKENHKPGTGDQGGANADSDHRAAKRVRAGPTAAPVAVPVVVVAAPDTVIPPRSAAKKPRAAAGTMSQARLNMLATPRRRRV